MRYTLDINGYVDCVFWGCYDNACTEYNGKVPSGYTSLTDWADNALINAYYISNGNLILDAEREKELKLLHEQQASDYTPVVHKELYEQQEVLETQYLKATATGQILELTDAKNIVPSVKLTNVLPGELNIFAQTKNMIKNDCKSETINGITFEKIASGKVHVTGTATAAIEYTISGSSVNTVPIFALIRGLQYCLSGVPFDCEFRYFNGETNEQVYTCQASGLDKIISLSESKEVTHVVIKIATDDYLDTWISPILVYGTSALAFEEYEGYKAKTLSVDLADLTGVANITVSGGVIVSESGNSHSIVGTGNVNLLNGYNLLYTNQGNTIEIEYCKNTLDVDSLEFLQGKNTTTNRFKILEDGSIQAHNGYFSGELNSEAGKIGGYNLGETSLTADLDWELGFSIATEEEYNYHLNRMQQIIIGTVTPTEAELELYDINGDGIISSLDPLYLARIHNGTLETKGKLTIDSLDGKRTLKFYDSLGILRTSAGIHGVKTPGIMANSASITQLHIENARMQDFVVEQGIGIGGSGTWQYRKWNSGISEAWGYYEYTDTHYNAVGPFYGYYVYVNLPQRVFVERPNVQFQPYIGSGFAMPARQAIGDGTKIQLFSLGTAVDDNIQCKLDIYAIGRWK